MTQETYEERFGPVRRRFLRVARACRWRVKGVLGRPRTILVEMRWHLGDEVMALPIYEALQRHYPNSRIHVLCTYPDLLEDNPHVTAVNGEPAAPAARKPCARPDRYVCLRSGPRNVRRIEHYARCAGVPTPAQRPQLYYRDWSAPQLAQLPRGAGALVALSSGASWPTKRWPIDRWRALGAALSESGCRVAELGSPEDEAIGVGTSLRGKTTVREAACVLHAADLLVCCDSGLMHLALAAGTRVLALFGPTDPTILVRDEPNLTVIETERDCRGCWNLSKEAETPGVCPLGRAVCLDAVEMARVLAEARTLLRRF